MKSSPRDRHSKGGYGETLMDTEISSANPAMSIARVIRTSDFYITCAIHAIVI
jgi:Ni,Fe-hydrogenase I large subunit